MINENKTLQLFGYISDQLTKGSHKPIIKVCDECGRYRISPKRNYRDLCYNCAIKHRNQQILPTPKPVKEEDRFIPGTGIDRILTVKKFGYDPIDLSKGLNRFIWCICQDCGKGRKIKYQGYHDLCKSCGRKGEKSSRYGIHL